MEKLPELFKEKELYLDNSDFFERGKVRALTYPDQKEKKFTIKDLKKLGVNFIYWYPGTGNDDEIKKAIKEYHKSGIRVGTSMGLSYHITEEFLDKHPEAYDWVAKDKDGSFRIGDPVTAKGIHYPCYNNPGFIDWVSKHVTKFNILGFDMFHLDNPGTDLCYCKRCQRKWEKYIKAMIGKSVVMKTADKNKDKRIKTCWDEFFYKNALDIIEKILTVNRAIRKDFKIDANFSSASPISLYNLSSNKTVDIICYEFDTSLGCFLDTWKGGVPPESEQIAGIKLYYGATNENMPMILFLISWRKDSRVKEGWHTGFSFLTPSVDRHSLCLAEAIAMGVSTNPGYLALWDVSTHKPPQSHFDKISQYYNFIAEYENIYKGAKAYSKIGIFFSPKSLIFSGESRTQPITPNILKEVTTAYLREVRESYYAVAETLMKIHQPFNVLVEGKFKQNELKKYDLIVLPSSPVMSEKTIILLKEYVENGGNLIITSKDTGSYDFSYQPRENNLLKILQLSSASKNLGKGKIILTSSPNFLGGRFNARISQKEFNGFDSIVKENVEEIIKLEGDNSDLVVVEPTMRDRNLVIHLLNYNYTLLPYNASQENILKKEKVIPAKNLSLTIKLPNRLKFNKVINISPEHSQRELKYRLENGRLKIKIPGIKVYEIVVMSQ